MHYKLAQLMLTPGRRSQTVSEIYVAQPDAIKEELAGKLFILIEVEENNADSLKIVNFLIDNINNNYYQNEKIYLREKISSLKVEHIFEAALAKTNKNLVEYLEKEKIKTNPRLINVTAGVLHENMIHFANFGKNKAFLIYKSNIEAKNATGNDENESYKIVDVAHEKNNKSRLDAQAGKFFNNVISGQIPEKGNFFFTNEALPEYISNNQLIQVVSTLPPLSATEQIKNLLTKINSYVSFLGIIIKSTTLEKVEERVRPIASTQESIANLNQTEETTESLLAPSGIVNSKKITSRLFSFFKIKTSKKTFCESTTLQDKIMVKRKKFVWLNGVFSTIKDGLINFINFFFFVFKSFGSKDKISALGAEIKTETTGFWQHLKTALLTINKRGKWLLGIVLVCLLIFIISVSCTNRRQQQAAVQQNYDNLVAQIVQKQNQADGYLLYNNEEGMRNVLNEIEALLKDFPQNTPEQKRKYQEIAVKTNSQLEKTRKITKISDTQEIANFINLSQSAQPQNITLISVSNKIYTGDSSQKSIYVYDLTKKLATAISSQAEPISSLLYPSSSKDNQIAFLNSNSFLILNASNDVIKNIKYISKTNAQNVASLAFYNNNVYLLVPADNQIYKYNRVGEGFLAPQNWLAEKVDLATTVSIAIDGSIYALKKNGEIIKLLKGKVSNFSLQPVSPAIEQATKLFFQAGQKYFYILEPIKNRIIVYDKNGQFILQYQSDQWNNLKDVAVDEKNKTIYLLNGTSLLQFSAQHIK